MTLDNHHYQRLEQIRDTYRDKRTLGYRLLDDCIQLAESAIAEHEAHLQGRVDQAERYVDQHLETIDRLRKDVARWQDVVAEKRKLTEARERAGDEVQVTITRSLKGWQVSDLEEIAYRLRCGGAGDDTPVKITDYTATANVPAPDLVRLERVAREPAQRIEYVPDTPTPARRRIPVPIWALTAAAVVGCLDVVARVAS